jgi:hypothetical protein
MRMRTLLVIAAVGAAAAIALGFARQSPLPRLQTGPPPWPPERVQLLARLRAIGIPALTAEGQVIHIHQHLDVVVAGKRVVVPAAIGFDAQLRFLSPIHTHDATGIIHVESPTVRSFTLGDVFDVWGVRFSRTCIGGECAGHGRELRVYVNGKLVQGDPTAVVLKSHQEIVVAYGTPKQLPQHVPSSYKFPSGL